jgi:lipoyl(octanoyl) transferase
VADELWCVHAGTVRYEEGRGAQAAIRAARHAGRVPDVLLLLEHLPVYTRGRRSRPEELPMGEDWYREQGIEVCETDRGGRVTYHGPGQLVGYPIVDLGAYEGDVHAYVRRLEQVMISSLGEWGLGAQVFSGLTGVWTAGDPPIAVGELGPQGTPVGGVGGATVSPLGRVTARKIGAIGVHLRRGISTHGFAINVNNDLRPFEWIVPCGIPSCTMTSLAREHAAEQDLDAFAATVAARFGRVCERELVPLSVTDLAAHVEGLGLSDPRGSASITGPAVAAAPR